MSNTNSGKNANVWISIVLIGVGVLFLLQNFDIFYIGDFWDYWPLLLIAVGVSKLLHSNFKDVYSASVLIVLGALLQIMILDIVELSDILQFWPVILIIIGIRIILNQRRTGELEIEGEAPTGAGIRENRVDAVAVFGGKEMHIRTEQFEGGNVTTLFGGTHLHFGNSKLAPGRHTLDVFAMFGGVEIYAPPDWNIILKGVPIFGGFSDSRKKIAAPEETSTTSSLIISGVVVFGGLEIKDA